MISALDLDRSSTTNVWRRLMAVAFMLITFFTIEMGKHIKIKRRKI